MSVKFITSIYSDLYGTEFGGRHARGGHYRYSLLSLLKMTDADFLCYTSDRELSSLEEFFYVENAVSKDKLKFQVFDIGNTKFKDLINQYKNIEESNVIESDLLEQTVNSDLTEEEANNILMRSFKITKPSLDNFVTIKYTKKPSEIILPKQKDINLKDPDLRNKGIRKKKNIINKYDENINSQKEITETTNKEK